MKKKYPRFGGSIKLKPHEKKKCRIKNCIHKAVAKVIIEVWHMRGDDEVFFACDEHLKMARQDRLDDFFNN